MQFLPAAQRIPRRMRPHGDGMEPPLVIGPLHVQRASLLPAPAPAAKPPVQSVFYKAIRSGDVAAVQALLRRGHSPNERDKNGSTPLIHAAWHGCAANGYNTAVAAALIVAGADVNAQNVRLNTALHFAYERHNLVLADFLLRHGAEASDGVRNGLGYLPRQLVPCTNPIKRYIQTALQALPDDRSTQRLSPTDRPVTSSGRLRRYINRTVVAAADGFSLADVFDAADLDGDRKISVADQLPVALRAVGLQWTAAAAAAFQVGGVRAVGDAMRGSGGSSGDDDTSKTPEPDSPSGAATGSRAPSHVDFVTFCRLVKVLQPTIRYTSAPDGASPASRASAASARRSLRRSASAAAAVEGAAECAAPGGRGRPKVRTAATPKAAPAPTSASLLSSGTGGDRGAGGASNRWATQPVSTPAAAAAAVSPTSSAASGSRPRAGASPGQVLSGMPDGLRPGAVVMRAHLRRHSAFALSSAASEAPAHDEQRSGDGGGGCGDGDSGAGAGVSRGSHGVAGEHCHAVRLKGPMPKHAVFLGGACNPTTWRQDVAMPMLDAAGVTYYNPQVDDWSPELISKEAHAKAHARVVLFVVAGTTRAVASMVEVSELITSGRNVVLVLQDVPMGATMGGQALHTDEIKDLNRGRAYLADVASRKGLPVYQSIKAGVEETLRRFGRGGPPSPFDVSP